MHIPYCDEFHYWPDSDLVSLAMSNGANGSRCFNQLTMNTILSRSPSTIQQSVSLAMPTTESLSLLLTVILDVCHALSQCNSTEMCWLQNTRGVSGYSSHISRQSIYPMTCLAKCAFSSECIAVTDGPNTENCEFHGSGPEGTPCLTWVTDVGFSFWMTKSHGKPCPKVKS